MSVPERRPAIPGGLLPIVLLAVSCGLSAPTDRSGQPSIARISPDTLVAGGEAVIVGSGFAQAPGALSVTIDSVPAAVIDVEGTSLTVAVPASLPCEAAHQGAVVVREAGGSATAHAIVRSATPVALAPGASVVVPAGQATTCMGLAQGAQYLVNVYSTAGPLQLTSFLLHGEGPAGLAARVAPPPAPRLGRSQVAGEPAAAASAGVSAAHERRLQEELAFLDARRSAFRGKAQPRPAAAPPTPGEIRTLRVPTGGCAHPTTIGARVVYVSQRAVLYEDTAWSFHGQMDPLYQRLGDAFDTQIYPTEVTYFGDPLLTDASTDVDGRIGMVFTPLVNQLGDLGFTSPCDLLPRDSTTNLSSNVGEYFYGQLPTGGSGGLQTGYTPNIWLISILGTVAHETKHLVSFEWRLVHHAASEEAWLEESLARVAEEVWSRNYVYHVAWKGDTGYDASVYCDQHPHDARCNFQPVGLWPAVTLMFAFLDSTDTHSALGPVSNRDLTYFSSGWSLVRWAVDRYATDEAATLGAITRSQSLTGLANIAAVTGASSDVILGDWSLALLLDDNPALRGNRDVDFPSWNLYDILDGLAADFPTFYRGPLPPVTVQVAGTFNQVGSIRGGGFLPIVVTTAAGAEETLILRAANGSATPLPVIHLAIARIH